MTPVCEGAVSLALVGYLVAAVLYPQRLLRPDSRSTRYAHWGLIAGAALQGLGLLAHAARGQQVFGQYANVTFVLVLVIIVGLLHLEAKTERPAIGAFLAPVAFLLVLLTLFQSQAQLPPIRNPYVISHVLLTVLADACFALSFCMAMAYLVKDALLKRKRLEVLPALPPLHLSERAAHIGVAIGFPLLTLGLGVAVAVMVANHLRPDLKVGLALLTWLVYASYLFLRDTSRMRGSRLHWLLIAGFALAVLNFVAARHQTSILHVLSASAG